jgi:hypothetical protein
MSDEKEIRIAHISDFHFTSQMKWPPQDLNDPWAACFRALKDDLEEQRPQRSWSPEISQTMRHGSKRAD